MAIKRYDNVDIEDKRYVILKILNVSNAFVLRLFIAYYCSIKWKKTVFKSIKLDLKQTHVFKSA